MSGIWIPTVIRVGDNCFFGWSIKLGKKRVKVTLTESKLVLGTCLEKAFTFAP